MVEILKTRRMINTFKYTNLAEVVARAQDAVSSVPLQLCPSRTYFCFREKAWLPESGVAQPRRVCQTPLGRADCHREYLACSFFKKHWVSIVDLSSSWHSCTTTARGLSWCQECPFWGLVVQRVTVADHSPQMNSDHSTGPWSSPLHSPFTHTM